MRVYTPTDLLQANAAWKASCGPGALAAALGLQVMELRRDFAKPWTTPTTMQAALEARRVGFEVRRSPGPGRHAPLKDAPLALAFVQLRGSWDSAPERAQYQHTHWVALATDEMEGRLVYDVNAGNDAVAGGWLPPERWKEEVLARITARHGGASGGWWVRAGLVLRAEGA